VGQSTVEFGLIFPVFLAAFLGLVMFSVIFFSFVTLQLAVREGASYLAHNPDATIYSVRQAVCGAGFAFSPATMYVRVEPPDSASYSGDECSALPGISQTAPNEIAYSGWQSGISFSVTGIYTVGLPTIKIPISGSSIVVLGPIKLTATSVMTFD
jgi:hypothetical protein